MDEDRLDLDRRLHLYEQYWETVQNEWREAHKYYDGSFAISKPADAKAIIPPTARRAIELASVELITDHIQVTRRRENHGERQRMYDDAIEAAFQMFLLDMEEYLQTPVFHEGGKLLMKRGATVIAGPFFDPKKWRVWIETYDPMSVFIEPGPYPTEAFIKTEMTKAEAYQLAAVHGWDYDEDKKNEVSKVVLVQWYQYKDGPSGRKAAWLQSEQGFLSEPSPSGYPYLPFDMISSGWGSRVPGAPPEEVYVGLLDPGVRDLLRAEAELFTLILSYARSSAWGRFFLPEGQTLPAGFVIETEPNSVTVGWPRELQSIKLEALPDVVSDEFQRIRQMLGEAMYSPILAGAHTPGVSTATQSAMMTNRGRRKFYPPIRMLQAGVSRALHRLIKLTMTLGKLGIDPVWKWRGYPLSAKMFGEDLSIDVKLLADDDEEKRMKIAEGVGLEGRLPTRIIWESYYGIQNYSAAYSDFLLDKVLNSPAFIDSIVSEYQGQVMAGIQKEQESAAAREVAHNQPSAGSKMQQLGGLFRSAKAGYVPTQQARPENLQGQLRLPGSQGGVPQVRGLG